MRLVQLSRHSIAFPSPEGALREPNGLLALGGDLSPARLLMAYQHGIFP
ncbi:leucyl/phenylalanyl-tRNA--protein transferase, partial [Salmonella enterica subsp. enterica serovar Senftenberg]|nr:leucyl/phenylalanyl-tRNA--protein transferase [Salmonella enterica subsp. enterica serovar Senftenberg]